MAEKFFPNRAFFWSFWNQVVFVVGMAGYSTIDTIQFRKPDAINPTLVLLIYIVLAGIFVLDSILQLCMVYHLGTKNLRYSIVLFSTIFDLMGSTTYLLGAIFAAVPMVSADLVWVFNTVGILAFLIGAFINMWDDRLCKLSLWANALNLIGASLLTLTIIITTTPWVQYITLSSDYLYLIDAILYIICWFFERRAAAL